MVALADLMPASFRGARFLCPRDHVNQGRNSIRHQYPGSSRSYVEDNGSNSPEYHLTCFLHNGSGTLAADWNRLVAALNKPGPGTLRHPWLGSKFCAVKGPWKVSRDDKDSGVLEVDITFLETGAPSFPGLVTNIAASISSLSAAAVTASFAAFQAKFTLPTSPFSQAYVTNIAKGVGDAAVANFPSTAAIATSAAAVEVGLEE